MRRRVCTEIHAKTLFVLSNGEDRTGSMSHRVALFTHHTRLSNGTTLAAGIRAPALARGVIMRHLSGVLPSLDRYAARCVNFVLGVTRMAVLGARNAPKATGNQPRGVAQISSGAAPWLVALAAVVIAPGTATAQERASLEGFGGLSINGLPSAAAPLPSLGGAVTFSIIPGIDIVGEAGRLGNVLPTMPSAAFSAAQTGLRASALYGEAGGRFVMAPRSAVTPYAEATAGVARLQLRSDRLGSMTNAAMSLAVGLVEGTTPTVGAGGGILLRGGPMVFDIGYRYKQLFASDLTRLALGFGQPLHTHEARFGIGVRF